MPSVLVQTTSGVEAGRKLVGTMSGASTPDMGHPEGDVLVEGLEHPGHEPGGGTGGTDDRQGARRAERPLDPARHGHIGKIHHVVGVHVGDEQGVEAGRMDTGLGQTQDGAPAGVELERYIT